MGFGARSNVEIGRPLSAGAAAGSSIERTVSSLRMIPGDTNVTSDSFSARPGETGTVSGAGISTTPGPGTARLLAGLNGCLKGLGTLGVGFFVGLACFGISFRSAGINFLLTISTAAAALAFAVVIIEGLFAGAGSNPPPRLRRLTASTLGASLVTITVSLTAPALRSFAATPGLTVTVVLAVFLLAVVVLLATSHPLP